MRLPFRQRFSKHRFIPAGGGFSRLKNDRNVRRIRTVFIRLLLTLIFDRNHRKSS
jgi:hypothetical protein